MPAACREVGLGLGGNESYPDLFQPYGGFPDGVRVEDGYITMPELPGIGFDRKADLLAVMRDLARSGMTMMVVTHELAFAREVGDDLLFMADGATVERGPPRTVLAHPREARTREFLSRVL